MKRLFALLLMIVAPCGILADTPPSGDALPVHKPGHRGEPRPRPAIEDFMSHLRESDPEAHARLVRLRGEDPEAFRAELRDRLRRQREERKVDGYKSREARAPGKRGEEESPKPGSSERGPKRPGGNLEEDEAVRRLQRQYHETNEEMARQRIRAELQRKAEEAFARRERYYAQRLERMERELEGLKAEWDRYQARREDLIRQRVDSLLRAPE